MSALVPPHSLEAEAAILGACMLDRAALDEATARLTADAFYSEAHRRIFEAVVELHAAAQPVDVVTLVTKLRASKRLEQVGGTEYVTELLNHIDALGHVPAYVETVSGKARLRAVIQTAQRIAAEGYAYTGEPQAFIDAAEAKLHEVARSSARSSLVPYAQVVKRVGTAVAEARRRGGVLPGISTGMAKLDELILGWREGRLYVLAARPGVGKTALAMGFALHVAAQGFHVPFFTLEMGDEELGTRALCATARINASRLSMATISDREWDAFVSAAQSALTMRMHIADDPNASVSSIAALTRRLQSSVEQRGEKLGLVVVDYLQLIEGPSRKNGSREQEVAAISRGLKKLAKELRCPILALSQLNRGVESRSDRPRLSDLRESGAIEQDADVVSFIHRLGRPKGADASQPNLHELIVEKSRGGSRGIVPMHFRAASTRFEELQEEGNGHGD